MFKSKSFFRGSAALALALMPVVALAASTKKKAIEQYSATEAEDGQAPETRPLLMPASGSSEETQFAGVAAAPQVPTNPTYPSAPAQAYNNSDSETLVDSDSVPLPLPPPRYGATNSVAAAPRPTGLTLAVIPPPPPPREDAVPFDAVPASQKSAIRKRIHLVDRMIAKYGRAYDYRTHTLRELRNIMAELDAQARR